MTKKVVKKDVYDELVKEVNVIDIISLLTKNMKITDQIESKIPSIIDLTTTAAFTAVANKIPKVRNLVKSADYFDKIKKLSVNISPHLIAINLGII